jgi:hypothetical protein
MSDPFGLKGECGFSPGFSRSIPDLERAKSADAGLSLQFDHESAFAISPRVYVEED